MTDHPWELPETAREDLADLLKQPPTTNRLKAWAEAVSGREKLLKNRIFGKIRWPKSVGRSLGATLASGVRGEIWFHYLNWAVQGDGSVVDLSKWVEVPAPDFWDLPDDGEFFQVAYGGWGVRPWMNAVLLDFATNQPWDTVRDLRVRGTYRVIVPPEQDFAFLEADFAVLDDATVQEVPIRFF